MALPIFLNHEFRAIPRLGETQSVQQTWTVQGCLRPPGKLFAVVAGIVGLDRIQTLNGLLPAQGAHLDYLACDHIGVLRSGGSNVNSVGITNETYGDAVLQIGRRYGASIEAAVPVLNHRHDLQEANENLIVIQLRNVCI